jgi:uncharacterized protein YjbJ (UPF0337 family)
MGFLDKLFGRSKETAGDAADKVEDAAAHAWDTSTEVADDAADKVKDTVSDLTHRGDDAAATEEPEPGTTGSSPTDAA